VLAEVRLNRLKHSVSRYNYLAIAPKSNRINEYKIKISQFNIQHQGQPKPVIINITTTIYNTNNS